MAPYPRNTPRDLRDVSRYPRNPSRYPRNPSRYPRTPSRYSRNSSLYSGTLPSYRVNQARYPRNLAQYSSPAVRYYWKSNWGDKANRLIQLVSGGRFGPDEREKERRHQRAKRHHHDLHRRAQNDGLNLPSTPSADPKLHTETAALLRKKIRDLQESRQHVDQTVIYTLAYLEGLYVTRPPRGRSRLAQGLIVRLGFHPPEGKWYFLSYEGYYYKSSDPFGHGRDTDLILDTFVPLVMRIRAHPYRALCRT
ncbi:hypothetical protein F5Y11DRAFT_340463 [Daldinia sp. FL1419]|nr:hypothetical protein F5Y11DRAFT_340463 [Daldinia sp. FL1419]